MKVKSLTVTGALVMATAGILTALPAQPAAADAPCLTGQVCIYRDGSLVNRLAPVPSGQCRWAGQQNPWRFDFIRNLSTVPQRAWSAINCMGDNVLVAPGTSKSISFPYGGNSLGGR
ncbi:hypothetical protein [Streptosporangium sp. KLBMP 9127]|nr:hypothetical protein [Streptosporangium sp. KLBMP 9127]